MKVRRKFRKDKLLDQAKVHRQSHKHDSKVLDSISLPLLIEEDPSHSHEIGMQSKHNLHVSTSHITQIMTMTRKR